MSDFTFEGQGKIKKIESGVTAKGGRWLNIVIETDGQYPQTVPVKVFGKMAEHNYPVGDMVLIKGTVGGREYNGKYYADVKASYITSIGGTKAAPPDDDDPPF